MRIRTILLEAAALLLAAALTFVPSASWADTPSYLPDSVELARVDDRIIRVYDFRDRFFSSDPDSRPTSDSTGRVGFLEALTNREVMSLEAVAAGIRLEPHNELMLKRYENQLLALWIYQRRVEKPVVITDRDLHDLYALESYQLRLRYLLLPEETTAQFLHAQLTHGRITWRDAAKRYSLGPDSLVDGDLGWMTRADMKNLPTPRLFALRPPGFSEVIRDQDGYKIWQCLDRKPVEMAPFVALRRLLLNELSAARQAPLEAAFFDEMRELVKPQYDSTAIVWLAERYRLANLSLGDANSGIDLRSRMPVIAVSDTGRVLATARGVKYTVGRFTVEYRDIPPVRRQRIATPSSLFQILERIVLEPAVVEYARSQGLQNSPDVLAEMQKKREGLLVGQMYDDSVQARISVEPESRKKYYADHKHEFRSRERVRYAVIPRLTEAGADSVIARLNAGESAYSVLAADSLNGWRRGIVNDLLEGQPHAYRAMLFEELKEGQSTKMYLGGDHVWAVFNVLTHSQSRQMEYAEVAEIIDQSLENIAAERLLNEMIQRLRKRHRVVMHRDRVMQVMLADPMGDWKLPSGE